ncbi:hypothetical protein HFU84_12135 [Acidithiobacillus sp. CV18-2]|uniref:Uncharacterized protein n=1 Tax=Igneacidithiobacillus copahuensis TaxID=2724909 RepID=A0AAE2YMU5_9PROT|nr:hypothetical protein [Igneacidithiobacillus copahuensis]MBU2755305.1 hypothetical protein [Acidithiobacillus sp. CV18-3]MBU2756025.1 hypothetical protein [Acidithiobacillus sp. BN09-2]MBU2778236.1 hypothetical protein [Acidithiobacillus sp. CV18-2]MBU2796861.1 hypothetical protein [Acidithiobacillus sp. VAN18-2]MBU2799109.1 hypothetical protein [Acidithiobacillus sp. VAN18-4]
MFEPKAIVPISYCAEWADGYGARGWKLDVALDDPEIIASTSDAGLCIPTSVLIHDILDHYLCGLSPSGQRAEASALHQLALRTGADPLPDLAQMVDEDLLHGRVIGETMYNFLPENLRDQLPAGLVEDRAIIKYLLSIFDKEAFRNLLIEYLVDLGKNDADRARAHYESKGLQYGQRGALGLAMQSLLVEIDSLAKNSNWRTAHAAYILSNGRCALDVSLPISIDFEAAYSI